MIRKIAVLLMIMMTPLWMEIGAQTEVEDATHTKVMVRYHPRTGAPYASLVASDDSLPRKIFHGDQNRYARPDYRMLDPKISSREAGYQGPSSNRTKVYALAAGLAASGVLAGTLLPVTAAPAAAAGSGTGLAAAGSGVAAGSAAAGILSTRMESKKDDFTHTSSSRMIIPLPIETDSV